MKQHVVTFPEFNRIVESNYRTEQDYTEEMKRSLMKKGKKGPPKISKMKKIDK